MSRQPQFDWYLAEWMTTLNVSQADLCRATGWPKAKMSELANGVSRYNRDVINELAKALNLRPYELLMPPELANAFKQFQISADALSKMSHDAEEEPATSEDNVTKFFDRKRRRERQSKKGTGTHG